MKNATTVGDAGTAGAGGLAATAKNPNKEVSLNGAPEGPFAHCLGYVDDGGMHGDTTVKGKNGATFNFK